MPPIVIALTAPLAASQVNKKPGTLRRWVHEGHLTPIGSTRNGAHLFSLAAVFEAERRARRAPRGRPRRHAA